MMASKPMVEKLKNVSAQAIGKDNYEKALAAISAAARILYSHNQYYADHTLEEQLLQVEAGALPAEKKQFSSCDAAQKTVLFYDGFGLDTRGLALIFLKALVRIGYRVIYVTIESAMGHQPKIQEAVQGYDFLPVYLPMHRGHMPRLQKICEAFDEYQPAAAFFYTQPDDAAAAAAFAHYRDRVLRFQIDLTDHAFWLGLSAFDYCVALRDVGAKIAFQYRSVPQSQILMLPYYATVDYQAPFQGFPFPTDGKRVIFSGGALYKTLGDPQNTYYKMADELLRRHSDLLFVYAGTGDDSQLKLLQQKHPDRVHHIQERSDLYQVLKHSVLYLNTYPMFGGLMMNYAATAGRLPLTLKHGHDADGLLFDQAQLGIEYDTMDELLCDADRLLTDASYLQQREQRLANSVITEERFQHNLQLLIEEKRTEFGYALSPIDTEEFRRESDRRFDLNHVMIQAIASRNNRSLAFTFPKTFLRALYEKITKKLS